MYWLQNNLVGIQCAHNVTIIRISREMKHKNYINGGINL